MVNRARLGRPKHSRSLVEYVQLEFCRLADPEKAEPMAKYMKTNMPFYGIQKPERLIVYKEIKNTFQPASLKQYEECVLSLWNLPHREEKYAAIEYASIFRQFVVYDSIPLYEHLIRSGAWWDFVDPLAIDLVGEALLRERSLVRPIMDKWITDDDMWIRRAALLSQNHHKKSTDQRQLFDYCLRLCRQEEFFIRKAIGWALREYSYVAPKEVEKFLNDNKQKLSPLSFKEGAKQLVRSGIM